jgi:hypothetical protein
MTLAAIASGSGRPKAPPATRPVVLFFLERQNQLGSSQACGKQAPSVWGSPHAESGKQQRKGTEEQTTARGTEESVYLCSSGSSPFLCKPILFPDSVSGAVFRPPRTSSSSWILSGEARRFQRGTEAPVRGPCLRLRCPCAFRCLPAPLHQQLVPRTGDCRISPLKLPPAGAHPRPPTWTWWREWDIVLPQLRLTCSPHPPPGPAWIIRNMDAGVARRPCADGPCAP